MLDSCSNLSNSTTGHLSHLFISTLLSVLASHMCGGVGRWVCQKEIVGEAGVVAGAGAGAASGLGFRHWGSDS